MCRFKAEFLRRLYSADDDIKAEAAVALAKAKVETILPILLEWFQGEGQGRRNAAIECMKTLGSSDARQALTQAFESGGRDLGDRATLASALLRWSNEQAAELLQTVARQATGDWSVMAATCLFFEYDPEVGLRLMLHLLDHGDLEAKRDMVGQISVLAHLPHVYTADGIHDARFWVEQQLMPDKLSSWSTACRASTP